MTKRKKIFSLCIIVCLFLFVVTKVGKLEAKEKQNQTEVKWTLENDPILKQERKLKSTKAIEYLSYQNLIYGFATEGNFTKSNPGSPGTPFIGLKDGDDIVHSIYDNGTGQTTSAINLYIGEDAQANYENEDYTPYWSGQAITNQKLNAETGEITADIVAGKGFKSALPLPFVESSGTARLYAKQGVIMQEFTYKNEGSKAVEVTPIKEVDTMLGPDPKDDEVPIYSRGPGKGLYMKDVNNKYRLDYMTDVKDGPITYAANRYDMPFADYLNFGSNLSKPTGQVNNVKDDLLMKDDDTGMFLIWKTKIVKPGETYTFRYGVGLKLGADFMVGKSAENQTQVNDKNNVGDIMKFSVTLSTQKLMTQIELTDNIPEGVSKPTDITYVNDKGETEHFETKDVYDEETRQIKMTCATLDVQGGVLSYKATIEPESDGKIVTSKSVALGIDYNNDLIKTESFYDLIVEKIPEAALTINYVDEAGKSIIPSKIEVFEVGQKYLAKLAEINGFEHVETDGQIEGIMVAPVTVTFHYKTHQFSLNQIVTNSIGEPITTVLPTEALFFQIELTSYLTTQTPVSYYDDFIITIHVDSALTKIEDLKLIRKIDQQEVGQIMYYPETKEIKAILTEVDKIDSSTDLVLNYQGTVDLATATDAIIQGNAEATGNYTGNPVILARKQAANEILIAVKDMAKLSILYLNEEGDIAQKINRVVKFNTIYDLTEDVDVQDNLMELKKIYELVSEPEDEKINITAGVNQAIYQFNGVLKLYSAPTGLDFGNKGRPIGNIIYQNPVLVGKSLIVSDTRINRSKWRLTAKLDQPLTSEINPDIVRPNAIQYQNSTEVKVLNDQETTIVTHMHGTPGEYNISEERWAGNEGFQIQLGQGSIATLGQYQAKMTIALENAR